MDSKWYTATSEDVLKKLSTTLDGLSNDEVARRIELYGHNNLPEGKIDSLFTLFLRQFKSPLIYILIGAGGIIFILGEVTDALVIAFVLLFNACVGALQEGRAQNTLRALKQFSSDYATVIRNGHTSRIVDEKIVPGDIIILQGGDIVPADARLLRVYSVRVDESSLTGESVPIEKNTDPLSVSNLPPADQKNMIFRGTLMTNGQATAVVVATGINTHIGGIARAVARIDTEIPLTTDINTLSRIIVGAVAILSVTLFILGVSLGNSLREMFAVVVSLAVSVIPEGLPIVVTLILASGVWRMSKRMVLIKRLQAVEALGQTDIIAVDKTGTITKNEMVVQRVLVNDTHFTINGVGYNPQGTIASNGKLVDVANHPELVLAGKLVSLSSDAHLLKESENVWHVAGDPTEGALTVFGKKVGCQKQELEQELALIRDIPFDSAVKYHASIHAEPSHTLLAVTGAPEVVLKMCTKIWRHGGAHDFTLEDRKNIEDVFLSFSQQGLRGVACAMRQDIARKDFLPPLTEMTFVALLGMRDVVRPEVPNAVKSAQNAGMKVVMVTGDNSTTAEIISREIGIFHDGDLLLTGMNIDALSDRDLAQKISSCTVFARVTPEHKLRIIRAFKKQGKIVAMTGDGVNDAPSLVAADLGVAMGKIGTNVAKEAADIILLDDNFGTIVDAAEEGRAIYRTLQKVLLYLFSTNIGEVLTIVGALVIGLPVPLVAAQIIWMNLVTDGFFDIALAMEPKDKDLLTVRSHQINHFLVDRAMIYRMILMAIPMAIGTLVLFSYSVSGDKTKALTIALATLSAFQWFNAFNCRSEHCSLFQMNFFSNKWLIIGLIIAVALQLTAVYTPFMNMILRTTPLSLSDWLIIIPISASVILVDEIRKLFARYQRRMAIQNH